MENENDVVPSNGDVRIRKARRKRRKLLMHELMYDYANSTTLHGLPYLTKPGRSVVEKMFWLITFLLSIAVCLYSITQVWIKWRNSPVIVAVNEQQVSVRMVPFPSVTICPQSKCNVNRYNYTAEKSSIEAFLEFNKDPINSTMKKRIEKFGAFKQVCNEKFTDDSFAKNYPYNNYSDYSLFKTIRAESTNFYDVFKGCFVKNNPFMLCRVLFTEVVTKEGICYNMNALSESEMFRSNQLQTDYKYVHAARPSKGWSVEHGYNYKNFNASRPIKSWSVKHGYNYSKMVEKKLNRAKYYNYYPMPGVENSESPDLEVILVNQLTHRDEICNGLNSGYKVYIHHPADFPQTSQQFYTVLNGQVSSMALSFNQMSSSERLMQYDVEVRQCYFPSERYLKYFNHYTENNCRLECVSNITFNTCGCVKFYMPHETRSICTVKHEECVKEAQEISQNQESDPSTAICRCLPSCNSVDYDAEIAKNEFNLRSFLQTLYKVNGFNISFDFNANYSKLDIYFKKPRFLSMRRSELFGTIDFFANCGGLLGLFLGFSVLSIIEIFYFLTLRLLFAFKNDLKEEKVQNKRENVY